MSTYEKKSLLDNRYQLLATSSIHTYEDDNLTSYADFLRKFGRYISKDGYVDSQQTIHRAYLKQSDKKRSSSEGGGSSNDKKKNSVRIDLSSVDIAGQEVDRRKKNEKHLKIIEDQMIQSKQAEREFKREEGDVKKEQRQIRQAVREFDGLISKKRLNAEKSLAKNLEERKVLEIENAHKKENKAKERKEQSIDQMVQSKDKGRKTLLVCNDLSRQYKIKMNELDLKKNELNTLHSDYEQRIRRKEEEEARIKKEVAEIALALNMETIKAKNDLFDFKRMVEKTKEKQIKNDLESERELEENIAKTSNYIKNYDMTRRRLSAENDLEKSQWSLRQREAQRRIVDSRNKLESIYQKQRSLNEAATIADQDRRANDIEKKIEDITNRRQALNTRLLNEKIQKSDEHEQLFKSKASHRLTELQAKDHEDHLKHFQKLVQKDDEIEQDLYKSVKEAEFQRRKKDMELKKLQEQLVETKKQNAAQIKELIARAYSQEQEIEQKLLKEKSKLDKYSADREETYVKLLSHRERVKEDKFLLETHEKEHNRLLRLVDKNRLPATSA
ncbi:unnamed protein product [Brachionus calyciflorus]|uniref:Uncharacterized protein n=1 Tax=Brachionus calyciflorus TaxID=104777 RepID=A0A813NK37_9BILA|nr:unnamed protein product [Brachionus calyciflorus]